MTKARALASFLAILFASMPIGANAQGTDRAQQLFDEAKKLAVANRYAEACPMLEESLRLDPALGTMFNLADCYEHVGKPAAAWRLFRRVEAEAHTLGQADREIRAHDRAANLDKNLARLAIAVPPSSRVADLRVLRDGELVPPSAWGVEVPVDIGKHEVRAEAPARVVWAKTVDVREPAKSIVVTVPELANDASAATKRATTDDTPATSGGGPSTLTWLFGAVGVAGLATGTVFGVLSLTNHTECTGPCTGPDRDRQSDAYVYGNVSTVAFGVGAVALAATIVLWAMRPSLNATAAVAR